MSKSTTTEKWKAVFSEHMEGAIERWREEQTDFFEGSQCQSEIEKLMLAELLFCPFGYFLGGPHKIHEIYGPGQEEDIEKVSLQNHVVIAPQHEIGPYQADFAIFIRDFSNDLMRIVVECDGHDFHEKTKEQAQRDKKRDRYIQAAGFRVFRFTGSEIFRDVAGCVSELDDFGADWIEKSIPCFSSARHTQEESRAR